MSKTMKILLPIFIVFAVAAIAINVYFNFFVPKPKRGLTTIEIPVTKEPKFPQELGATR